MVITGIASVHSISLYCIVWSSAVDVNVIYVNCCLSTFVPIFADCRTFVADDWSILCRIIGIITFLILLHESHQQTNSCYSAKGTFTLSPGTRSRVHGNKKPNAIQWQLFTFVWVVYESKLPMNSTRTSRVCTGHVSREPVQADYRLYTKMANLMHFSLKIWNLVSTFL